jgi:peptidoglycan/LPS O-acetylase OafA/YrhL
MLHNIYNKFRRITTNQLYFPEIDGIRFLAIILVLLFHMHGYFAGKSTIQFADDPGSYSLLNLFLVNGDRGVELFFVLSGFILCLPFAHQYINHGKKMELKKYYLRRVTRLEPPYFIAMTVIFLLHIVTHMPPPQPPLPGWTASWLASLIYSHGIIYHHTPLLTVVAWSLEVEIQFYLLAPLLFSLLSLHKTARRIILLMATILLIVAQKLSPPTFHNLYGFGQYFLTGILLADFYVSDTASGLFNKKWMSAPAVIILATIIFFPIKNEHLPADTVFIFRLCFPFCIGLFYYIVLKNDIVKKIFSYKFIPIIGGMCYSIYLLHYTIISMFGRYTLRLHITSYYLPNLLLQVVLLGIPVLVISSVFYYYIERPFMSRKWMDMLMKKDKREEETNMQGE